MGPDLELFIHRMLYLTTCWLIAFLSTSLRIHPAQLPYIWRSMHLKKTSWSNYAFRFFHDIKDDLFLRQELSRIQGFKDSLRPFWMKYSRPYKWYRTMDCQRNLEGSISNIVRADSLAPSDTKHAKTSAGAVMTKVWSVHYSDVIISAGATQATGVSIVYSTVCSGADQRKHQSSTSLAFMWGIQRWPVNSLHKGQVTREVFPFDDVIMIYTGLTFEGLTSFQWNQHGQ